MQALYDTFVAGNGFKRLLDTGGSVLRQAIQLAYDEFVGALVMVRAKQPEMVAIG